MIQTLVHSKYKVAFSLCARVAQKLKAIASGFRRRARPRFASLLLQLHVSGSFSLCFAQPGRKVARTFGRASHPAVGRFNNAAGTPCHPRRVWPGSGQASGLFYDCACPASQD